MNSEKKTEKTIVENLKEKGEGVANFLKEKGKSTLDYLKGAALKLKKPEAEPTMVDTYKELVTDSNGVLTRESWMDSEGASKIKRTGTGGTMTALDEIENNAMYNAYVSQAMADKAYKEQKNYLEGGKDSALEANAQNRADAMRENAIITERAKEYAEKRALLNGMGKTGVSQTAMIDLYSQMAGARADAQASYDNQERTIIQEYQDALFEAQRERDAAVMNAQNTANLTASDVAAQRAQQSEIDRKNKVDGLVTAIAEYEAGVIDYETFSNRYEKLKGYLTDADVEVKSNIDEINKNREAFFTDYVGGSEGTDINEVTTNEILDSIDVQQDLAQRKYVNNILKNVQNGTYKDGTIIHFNNGAANDGDDAIYVLYGGKLYQTTMRFKDMAEAERKGIPVISDREKNYWANNY